MNRKVLLAFCSAILTILIAGAFAYRALTVYVKADLWVQHTHYVLAALQEYQLSIQAAESSYRYYLLSASSANLQSFRDYALEARQEVAIIHGLTLDNPVQRRQIDALQSLTDEEIQFGEAVIALRSASGRDAAITLAQDGRGLQIQRNISAAAKQMQAEELRLRIDRGDQLKFSVRRTYIALLFAVLLGFTIAIGATSSLYREVIRRRRAEDSAKAGEENFRCLLDAAPDSMIVLRPNGEILLVNLRFETQFGYTRCELPGASIDACLYEGPGAELPHADSAARIEAITRRAGSAFELCGRRKDSSAFPAEIILSKLNTAEGPLLIAAVRDITERRNAERQLRHAAEELKRSNSELQQFAYAASHDLQEPLRMITNYVQLIEKRYKGHLDSNADEFIAFAVDGCMRMKRLIQDLLTYSRAGGQKAPSRPTSCDLALDSALANLAGALQENHATVTRDPLPSILADPTQISRVLQNLIGNALKYRSADPPNIHVSATCGEGGWVFSVQDNGIGIEPRYFERIFLLFQRLHGPGEVTGSGIGLSICQKIIGRMGGRIWVDSEPGNGSIFYFSLPENPPVELLATSEITAASLSAAE